ncbi:hypothetical protein AOLI_G00230140 [Acnodon oligacanthus]
MTLHSCAAWPPRGPYHSEAPGHLDNAVTPRLTCLTRCRRHLRSCFSTKVRPLFTSTPANDAEDLLSMMPLAHWCICLKQH